MRKHRFLPGIILPIAILSIVSCSKSSSPTPTTPAEPKRLVECWTHKGQPDAQGVKLEYDSQGRIVKRTNAIDPTTYETYTYTGTALTNHKAYSGGNLSYDLTGSFTVTADTIVEKFIHKDGAGTVTDTTWVTYGLSGANIRAYNVLIHLVGGSNIEVGYVYSFSGDNVSSVIDRSAQDGVVYPNTATTNVLSVDTHVNPFYEMGPLNQALAAMGTQMVSKGKHNITQMAGTLFNPSSNPISYTWTYDADGYPLAMRQVGSSVDEFTYVYSR